MPVRVADRLRKRFLILGPEPGATAPLTLVQHWTRLLERRD
jgi:hypothetical protein